MLYANCFVDDGLYTSASIVLILLVRGVQIAQDGREAVNTHVNQKCLTEAVRGLKMDADYGNK